MITQPTSATALTLNTRSGEATRRTVTCRVYREEQTSNNRQTREVYLTANNVPFKDCTDKRISLGP